MSTDKYTDRVRKLFAKNGGRARRSEAGYEAGVEAGSRVDLGGKRVGGRAAIGA